MITVASPLDDLTLDITQETRVQASIEDTFAAMLEEIGPHNKGMGETWRMQVHGADIMAMPRIALLRTILLNHWYHHRGQLSVYLRLLDVPLPSIYGPSADENPFQR